MSAKWCHGCATLYASIDNPTSLWRFYFLWVQINWPDYRAYGLDLSHSTNIEMNKIKLLNHAISFTNLSCFFFNAYLFKTIVMLQSSSKSILHSQTQCKFKTCRKNLQLCAYIKSSLHVVIQRNLLIEKKISLFLILKHNWH